jgi:hypothetical protein
MKLRVECNCLRPRENVAEAAVEILIGRLQRVVCPTNYHNKNLFFHRSRLQSALDNCVHLKTAT